MPDDTVTLVCDGASGDPKTEYAFAMALEHMFDMWKGKHADYGPGNIALCGGPGVYVRSLDKMMRLRQNYNGHTLEHESLADTWKDLAVYAVIGWLVETVQWPQADPQAFEDVTLEGPLRMVNEQLQQCRCGGTGYVTDYPPESPFSTERPCLDCGWIRKVKGALEACQSASPSTGTT